MLWSFNSGLRQISFSMGQGRKWRGFVFHSLFHSLLTNTGEPFLLLANSSKCAFVVFPLHNVHDVVVEVIRRNLRPLKEKVLPPPEAYEPWQKERITAGTAARQGENEAHSWTIKADRHTGCIQCDAWRVPSGRCQSARCGFAGFAFLLFFFFFQRMQGKGREESGGKEMRMNVGSPHQL